MATGRTQPLHTIATVRHPRTIELITYITSHAHSNPDSSQSHSMQSSSASSSLQQHSMHSTDIDHTGSSNMQARSDHSSSQSTSQQQQQHSQSPTSGQDNSIAADVQMVSHQRDSLSSTRNNRSKAGAGLKQAQAAAPALSVDMLLPDELLSGLLTQCSGQPELLSVMEDLFDSAGKQNLCMFAGRI